MSVTNQDDTNLKQSLLLLFETYEKTFQEENKNKVIFANSFLKDFNHICKKYSVTLMDVLKYHYHRLDKMNCLEVLFENYKEYILENSLLIIVVCIFLFLSKVATISSVKKICSIFGVENCRNYLHVGMKLRNTETFIYLYNNINSPDDYIRRNYEKMRDCFLQGKNLYLLMWLEAKNMHPKNYYIAEFMTAVEYGKLDICKSIQKLHFIHVEDIIRFDCNAFILAAKNGCVLILDWLKSTFNLKSIYDVKHGYYAMIVAAENGYVSVLKWLIENFHLNDERIINNLNRSFQDDAKNQYSITVKWLSKKFDAKIKYPLTLKRFNKKREPRMNINNPGNYMYYAFMLAASYGHLHVLKYLTDVFKLTFDDIMKGKYNVFRKVASRGYVDILQWLIKEFKVNNPLDLNTMSILKRAAKSGHLHVLQFLTNTFDLKPDFIRGDYYHVFLLAVLNGHLHILKWLKETVGLSTNDVRNNKFPVLQLAAEQGHLHIIKWLFSSFDLTIEDIKTDNYKMLQFAVKNGKLHILKWVVKRFDLTIENINIKNVINQLFISAVSNGYLNILQWMDKTYDLTLLNIKNNIHSMLLSTVTICSISVLQWLIERFEVIAEDIKKNNNEIFVKAILQRCDYVVMWLIERFNFTRKDIRTNDNILIRTEVEDGRLDMLEWLIEKFKMTREDILKSCTNETLKIAEQKGYKYIVEWLKKTNDLTQKTYNSS